MKGRAGTELGGPGARTPPAPAHPPAGRAPPGTSAAWPRPPARRRARCRPVTCYYGAAGRVGTLAGAGAQPDRSGGQAAPRGGAAARRGEAARGSRQAFVCATEQQPNNLLLLLLVTTLCGSLTFILPREGERAESVIAERTRRRQFPGRGPLRRGSRAGGAGRTDCPARRPGPARWALRRRPGAEGRRRGGTARRAPPPRARSEPFGGAPGTRRGSPALRPPQGRPPVSVPAAGPAPGSAPVRRAAGPRPTALPERRPPRARSRAAVRRHRRPAGGEGRGSAGRRGAGSRCGWRKTRTK